MAQKVTFSHLIAYPKYISTKQPGSKQAANSQPASQPARQAARQQTGSQAGHATTRCEERRQPRGTCVCVHQHQQMVARTGRGAEQRAEQSRAEQSRGYSDSPPACCRSEACPRSLAPSAPCSRRCCHAQTPVRNVCAVPSTRQRKASYSRMRVSQTTCVSRSSVCWRSN